MMYVLPTAVVLLVLICAGTAALMYLATRDAADDAEDDDDERVPLLALDDEPYVNPVPPFAILYLGQAGEHDRYPLTPPFRQSYIDYLELAWNLPAREPTR